MNTNARVRQANRLFDVRDRFDNPLDRGTAQGVLVVNGLIFSGSVFWLGVLLLLRVQLVVNYVPPVLGVVMALLVSVTLAAGQLRAASRLLVLLAVLVSSFVILYTDTNSQSRLLTGLLPLVLAGVLLERNGIVATGAALVVVAMIDPVVRLDPATGGTTLTVAGEALAAGTIIALATAIQALFVGRQRLVVQQALTAVNGLEQVLAATESIDLGMGRNDVLSTLIRLLRRNYQFDAVQVYLADSQGRLVQLVRAGLRRTEVIDLDDGEIITPGDTHPLSDAARFREPIQVLPSDPLARREFFMPAIQQALAVPLVDGDTLLGVLDIQSAQPDTITAEQVRTITLMAGGFATLANLVQSNELLSQSLREQEMVASRAQAQLASEQAQRREMVTNIWSDYIDERGAGVVGFDVAGNQVTPAADMPDEMREALAQRGEYLRVTADAKILSVPILLRGETLGAMSFTLPVDHIVTERQRELARTIALRLGTALENTRLLEQTRLRAARERKATEISTLLFSASDVDALLKLAADNFNDTLGAIQTRIFVEPGALGDPPPPDARTNGHNRNGDHA